MRATLLLAFLLALSPLNVSPGLAQQGHQRSGAPHFTEEAAREKANENLVMLLAGTLGGPYIQLAQDIASVVDDGDNRRVFPITGAGAVRNVRDILLIRGVDLAITSITALNSIKESGEFGPNLDRRIAYITTMSVDIFHVLAQPEFNSLKDLKGKRVGFNPKGSATATFGPEIFKVLGIEVEEINVTPGDAVQLLRNGKLDAAACLCPMPVPAYRTLSPNSGLKFLEVGYVAAFEDSYLPANLPSETYPNLVPTGTNVQTIGTSTVLVTYNWPPGGDRYRKIDNFVNGLFSNFDKLRQPPHHPSWREVNIAANLRGWRRFPAAQQWLDREAASATSIDAKQVRSQAARAAPHDAAQQDRLFKEFMEWARKQGRR